MPKFDIEMKGIDDVMDSLGLDVAAKLEERIDDDLEQGIDDMAENSYDRAPVDTGALRASILASVEKEAPLTWVYGSHLPYAQRQEYEHKSKRGYFRFAVWEEMVPLQEKIAYTVKRTLS